MRHTWLVLIIVASLAATVGGSYLFVSRGSSPPPDREREPYALLLVSSRPQLLLPGPTPTPSEIEVYRQTQAGLLKNDFVLNAALRTPTVRDALKPQADPVAWLSKNLMAEYGDKSELLRVWVTGLPPREAAIVVNAVVEAYIREVVEKQVKDVQNRRRQLEDMQQTLRQRLGTKRGELVRQAQAAGLPPETADHRAALAALYQERSTLRVEAIKAKDQAKPFRDELTTLEQKIRQAEETGSILDELRAEIARIRSIVEMLSTEQIRTELELNAPARIQLVQKAEARKE